MIKKIPLLLFIMSTNVLLAQKLIDSATFNLHKFAQNIGQEKYTVTADANKITYNVSFKFVDRGSAVPLKATLVYTNQSESISFLIKGKTSRFSTINDSIELDHENALVKVNDSSWTQKVKNPSFIIDGYSPGTAQMMLIRYWKSHHEPSFINVLPAGQIRIKKDGEDKVSFNNITIDLDRYVITGLIWGNELVWMDKKQNLFCLITNDAEGDKLEMMRSEFESLLPDLINKAAGYGMRLFTNQLHMQAEKSKIILVKGGTLIDVLNKTSIADASILIENGIIKRIGGKELQIPSGSKIIDAKGKYILPGLWDMHAHFEQAEWGPAYLGAGVTTVRDCGNEFEYINSIKDAIDKGKGIGPNILKAGIIDGKGPFALGIIQAANKEEAIAQVDRYKKNGFVQIKIYSSVKPAIVKVICDEAHKLGLTVTGHIPQGMKIMQAIDSGMDMVNHVQYVYSALKKGKDMSIDFNDSSNKAVFTFLKNHHTVIDPTLGVFEMSFRSVKDNIREIEPAFNQLPQPLQTLFINTGMTNAADVAYGKNIMKNFIDIVRELYKNHITIVAGTDMLFPGLSVYRELELYVNAGMTPIDAIRTATIIPAQVMKENNSGSITEGNIADLIIVDNDPLQNISNIRTVQLVIKKGSIYNPKELQKLAGFRE